MQSNDLINAILSFLDRHAVNRTQWYNNGISPDLVKDDAEKMEQMIRIIIQQALVIRDFASLHPVRRSTYLLQAQAVAQLKVLAGDPPVEGAQPEPSVVAITGARLEKSGLNTRVLLRFGGAWHLVFELVLGLTSLEATVPEIIESPLE